MKWIFNIINFTVSLALLPVTKYFIEVELQTPECCDNDVEFIGNHTSLFDDKLFYQCCTCKKVITISNQHPVAIWHLWKLIYMPRIGITDENISN